MKTEAEQDQLLTNARVVVAIPSGDQWNADFCADLLQMFLYTRNTQVGGLQFNNYKGSILPIAREQLAENACNAGATHLLFVDTDMRIPAETVVRLLLHDKPVVAANCVTKRIPAIPTARQYDPMNPGGKVVYTPEWQPGDEQLEQVWRVGTGVMMIKTEVFEQVKKPWFPIVWEESMGTYRGEDWSFCMGLAEAEIPIYIDHPLSLAVEHQGKFDYGMAHVAPPEDEVGVIVTE